jgi:hypothetical protein
MTTKYDDVLAAADAYANAGSDKNIKDKLRWALENAITSYAQAWADELNAIDKAKRDKALEAARLLCANLDNGGVGHKSLVENFRKMDEEVK